MKKNKNDLKSLLAYYKIDIVAFLLVIFFCAAGIIVSLHRFWQYEASLIDFGHFDQIIWNISRFQEPIVNHFIHGRINAFGDHLTPSVALISPLYWITNKSEMILVVQAVAVGLSGIFLYDIGRVVLKNKTLSLSVLVSYFLFVGLQNAVITEFHELTVMTLPFMIAFWALVKNKIPLYFIFLIISLGFKESTFALGIGLGIALFFLEKKWKNIGVATIILSCIWGVLALKVIIPYFSSGEYLYTSAIPEGISGKVTAFFDVPEKRRTIFFSFFSFSFLPILSPEFWLMILQDYAGRFLPSGFVTRWNLGLHYNAQSAIILSLASIYGLRRLLKIKLINKYKTFIAIVIIINSIFLFRFIMHGPFLLAINPEFYRHTSDFKFLNDMVKKVPKDASIMTQNNLGTRFTHQPVSLVKLDYDSAKPDYILLDVREGQGPNNYFGSDNLDSILDKLKVDKNYILVSKTGDQYLFMRQSL